VESDEKFFACTWGSNVAELEIGSGIYYPKDVDYGMSKCFKEFDAKWDESPWSLCP
jgi:hypothetical protein